MNTNLIKALKTIPETKLKVIALVWELLDENGRIDQEKAAYDTTEVDIALAEAEKYAENTEHATAHLRSLIRRP